MRLRFVSMMADNSAPLWRGVTRYLANRCGGDVVFDDEPPWQTRQRMLYEGEAHLGVICGLPYAIEADRPQPRIVLVAAQVMSGERYAGRAVYFSDVVVRANSSFQTFSELRDARWAYNEPVSHSGYFVTRYTLARAGECDGFFREALEAGSHQRALRMIVDGDVDAAAIDSTVLETECQRDPAVWEKIRVIGTMGPSSMPPVVASSTLPAAILQGFRGALLGMHRDAEGRTILARAGVSHFLDVEDRAYDDIRDMARWARGVRLGRSGTENGIGAYPVAVRSSAIPSCTVAAT